MLCVLVCVSPTSSFNEVVSICVHTVFVASNDTQIIQGIVTPIAVYMVNLVPLGNLTQERFGNKAVDKIVIPGDVNLQVAPTVVTAECPMGGITPTLR